MRSRLAVFILLVVSLIFGLLFARQMYRAQSLPRVQFAEKKLRLLTYSTFVGANGPGGEILDQFKKDHGCEWDVVTAGDAGLMVERLKMANASVPFDIVLGLDQFLLAEAKAAGPWKTITIDRSGWFELPSADGFVPFDWSPMSFVYRQGEVPPPQNFHDLLDARFRGKSPSRTRAPVRPAGNFTIGCVRLRASIAWNS